MNRTAIVITATIALILALFAGCLLTGTVDIPSANVVDAILGRATDHPAWDYIVVETRLPAACTALLTGAALSVAGLLMQTMFDNPLAGPSILGISTGAGLGVAIVMLAFGGALTAMGQSAVLIAAIIGALAVMILLLAMSSLLRNAPMLLIVGILLGYLASSAISLLNFFASREGVHSYVLWGMGNFSSVTLDMLPLMACPTLLLIMLSMLMCKPLNALLLGTRYAESTGVNLRATRNSLLLISGALTALATAWCGPIAFIGMVVPHIARLALHSSDHRRLLPATALIGAATGLLCLFLSAAPSTGIIPINAITPIIGVPVIIYIIVRRRSIFYFN
jgi:iron complex transport system permease protein